MPPQKPNNKDAQNDLFLIELQRLVDSNHPLIRLSQQIDWEALEQAFTPTYCPSNGRSGCSTRLMVGLHYLKHTSDLSDEEVLREWVENPYWQYVCGEKFFQHEAPIDSSSMSRWRTRIQEVGAEKMLHATIQAGLKAGLIKPQMLERVNVDTTVQEKDIRFPTDARLYHRARQRLVDAAKQREIPLRQNYNRNAKHLLAQQSRHAHARQMKRAKRCTRTLKTYLGRVIRDIERKCPHPDKELQSLLDIAARIFHQQRQDKNKIYSVHEPAVECISKGKAHKRYEFGCKVSVAATSRGGWFVGAKALHGNPYDGHTLKDALKQIERIVRVPEDVFVDMGYRGHGYTGDVNVHVDKRRRGRTAKSLWRWMKRRAAVEPGIGHLKQEHRMDRCRLKGTLGDCLNAIFSAAGMNFRKLLRLAADFLRQIYFWISFCQRSQNVASLAA